MANKKWVIGVEEVELRAISMRCRATQRSDMAEAEPTSSQIPIFGTMVGSIFLVIEAITIRSCNSLRLKIVAISVMSRRRGPTRWSTTVRVRRQFCVAIFNWMIPHIRALPLPILPTIGGSSDV